MELINGYQIFQNQFQQNSGNKQIQKRDSKQIRQQSLYKSAGETKQTKQQKAAAYVRNTNWKGTSSVATGVQLSDSAKSLLEELKEKYQNMDFFVACCESDEEEQSYLSRGTKEYSVLIDPDTLETMAADKETKEKYINIIDSAVSQMEDIKEKLGEDEEEVRSIGVKIDKEGNTTFFAELQKVSDSQKEWMEQMKNKKAEDKKHQEELEKKRAEKRDKETNQAEKNGDTKASISGDVKITRVSATSVDELIEKIRSVDWMQVENVKTTTGACFDFTV